MKHSTGTPTKAEQARFDKMKEIGLCVACYQRRITGRQHIEIHHLLSGNKRIGHMATVSLCPWHHRGIADCGTAFMTKCAIGPSLAHGSKPFRAEFGTDKDLLVIQNLLIEDADDCH